MEQSAETMLDPDPGLGKPGKMPGVFEARRRPGNADKDQEHCGFRCEDLPKDFLDGAFSADGKCQ